MRPGARTVAAVCVGGAVFLAAANLSPWGWSLGRVHLLAKRELYELLEAVRVMDTSAGLGGQVYGHNFARDPAWAHWVVGGLAAAAGYGPALVASVLVARRVRGDRVRTVCGKCGAELRGLKEAKCPVCGAGL